MAIWTRRLPPLPRTKYRIQLPPSAIAETKASAKSSSSGIANCPISGVREAAPALRCELRAALPARRRGAALGPELNPNLPVDRKNGGHIRRNDRLAIQPPAESRILRFRPGGYDGYTGCHKSDNCGAASSWARRFLFSLSRINRCSILGASKLGS
jgi:hypothetical protein